jgi:hypothetical protein
VIEAATIASLAAESLLFLRRDMVLLLPGALGGGDGWGELVLAVVARQVHHV